jgi:transposase InsO family protein
LPVTVERVYYHPSFSINLISVLQLNKSGWTFVSTPKETYLMTPGDNLKVQLNRERNVTTMRCHSGGKRGEVYSLTAVEPNWNSADDLVSLHCRLGHMGFDRMVRIIKGGSTVGLGKLSVRPEVLEAARKRVLACRACIQGKGTRTAFGHRGVDKGSALGEVLHMDTYYAKVTRADGTETVEYGLTVTDSYTKLRWFTRLLSKDQGAQAVVDIIRMAREQLGPVKRMHSDGGSEFINNTVKLACQRLGIEMHWGPKGTPQLNPIAERNVRSHKDGGRTLLQHAVLPTRFWARAVAHSVFVWNRTHVAEATGVTPYQTVLKRKPSLEHIGVFGCDCYYHVAKSERDAFDAKMLPGIYLGHGNEPGTERDSAVVLDLRSGKEVRTRDVRFLNDSFKHAAALVAGGEQLENVLLAGGPSSDAPASAPARYDVDRIIGKRKCNGRTEYHVLWEGYDEDEATWEPIDHVQGGAQEAIDDFEAQLLEGNADEAEVDPDSESAEEAKEADSDHEDAAADDDAAGNADDEPLQQDPDDAATDSDVDQKEEPAAQAPSSRPRPRRSPRGNPSSVALDALDVHQRMHMAMSAICSSVPGGDEHLGPSDSEMVMAVASGLSLLEDITPANWKEAMASPQAAEWRAACDKEMAGCQEMHVWDLVERSSVPKHQVVVPVKWVFKIKVDSAGKVDTYKARVTPKGFHQREGINYFETFAATGKYKTMRLGLALTALFDHELDQLDVPQAFLNADLPDEEEVYMELPEGYRKGREHLVCRLLKALYGLKQAPRQWQLMASKFIREKLGFKPTVSDPCLFFKRSRTGRVMWIFLFVDDFQVSYFRDDRAEWNELKAMLVERFKTKDLGPSTWILGMRIKRDRKLRTISLDQELYITKALERYGLQECKVAPTPGVVGSANLLGPVPADAPASASDTPADKQLYQEIVGTLMYASVSCRPDIAHQVQLLARSMQAPMERHMTAAKRVLRYLAGTKDIGLIFGSSNGDKVADSRGRDNGINLDVCCFADADWANCPVDRKSVYGWVAKVNGNSISWASKKQRTVAQSTCEAELYAEAEGIKEVLWLRGLLKELGLSVATGSRVFRDNQSTIAISQNGIRSERTKHVDVKYHFITETVASGQVQLQWIPTRDQEADLFTKALAQPVFEHFRKLLMTR